MIHSGYGFLDLSLDIIVNTFMTVSVSFVYCRFWYMPLLSYFNPFKNPVLHYLLTWKCASRLCLLCAGITTYSPLKSALTSLICIWVWLVYLCQVAVKFDKAFGSKVLVISASPNKQQEAPFNLSADSFLVCRDP